MKPFKSPTQMLDAHEAMFGDAGKQAAEMVLRWAPTLFEVPLDPLSFRVVLAPIEIGPYNNHGGYCAGAGSQTLILGNRHQCRFCGDTIAFDRGLRAFEDFICHELTHSRQAILLREYQGQKGWKVDRSRGFHKDKGWYSAISEAAPNYLGVEIPPAIWPRKRGGDRYLEESAMVHWPAAIRDLAEADDPRLSRTLAAA